MRKENIHKFLYIISVCNINSCKLIRRGVGGIADI